MPSITDLAPEQTHEAVVVPIQFDITTSAIAEMQQKADSLSIDGPDDKDGFKQVYEFRQVVRRQRISLEKRADALKQPHKDYIKRVDAAADSLVVSMKAIENNLAIQEKAYNDERERIAEEKAKAERVRFHNRVQQLQNWGFKYDEFFDSYILSGVSGLCIITDDIKQLSDEDYQPTVELAQQAYDTEQARLAEEARLAEQERQRIEAEQKAEADRLAKIAADQRAEAERLALAERQLKEAEERARQIELKARLVIRTPEMIALGFVEEELRFNHPTAALTKQYIAGLADQDFCDLLPQLADRQRQWEAQQRWDKRLDDLLIAGFVDEGPHFSHIGFTITKPDVSALMNDEFNTLIEGAARRANEAERARIKADKDRQKRLAPDKEKLRIYLESAGDLIDPKLSQVEIVELQQAFDLAMESLVNEYISKLDAL